MWLKIEEDFFKTFCPKTRILLLNLVRVFMFLSCFTWDKALYLNDSLLDCNIDIRDCISLASMRKILHCFGRRFLSGFALYICRTSVMISNFDWLYTWRADSKYFFTHQYFCHTGPPKIFWRLLYHLLVHWICFSKDLHNKNSFLSFFQIKLGKTFLHQNTVKINPFTNSALFQKIGFSSLYRQNRWKKRVSRTIFWAFALTFQKCNSRRLLDFPSFLTIHFS